MKKKDVFYAVFKGRIPGIYTEWYGENGALEQISGFSNAVFKKITTLENAKKWLKEKKDEEKVPETFRENYIKNLKREEKKNEKGHNRIEIYTDGGCNPNPGTGAYCSIIKIKNKEDKIISEGFENTTNNRMELMACISGLKSLKKPSKIILYTDSKYISDAINKKWLEKWKNNKWKKDNKELLNSDLWIQLDNLLNKHDVIFTWVKGHSGNEYNEKCDEISKNIITEMKKQKIMSSSNILAG